MPIKYKKRSSTKPETSQYRKKSAKKTGRKASGKAGGKAKKKYKITIIAERCKGCKLCVTYCPTDTLEMSEKINEKGYFVPQVVNISKCKGCNLCSKYCPDFAIFCEEITK